RMYVIGMTGFTIASALCGFARSPTALVGSRLLQGAFAAVMVPQALSFIQVTFTPREQSLAYAMYGMTIGFGMIAGQLLGGLLLSADLLGLGWRPVFLVNLPFGVVAITLAWWLVRESRAPAGLKLDPAGVVLLSAALALLLYPLIRGEAAGWPTWTWLSLAGAVVLMAVFLRYERWKTDRGGSPLLVLSLFRHRSFVVGLGVGLSFFSVLAPFLVLLTEYLQSGLDLPPRAAGLRFLPFAIGFLSASFASARLAPRLGRAILQLGAALMVTGLLTLMAVVHSVTLDTSGIAYILPLVIYGLGQGTLQAPLVNFILADVPPEEAGSASGVVTMLQQLSFALGVAVIGSVFLVALGPNPGSIAYGRAFGSCVGVEYRAVDRHLRRGVRAPAAATSTRQAGGGGGGRVTRRRPPTVPSLGRPPRSLHPCGRPTAGRAPQRPPARPRRSRASGQIAPCPSPRSTRSP